MRKAQLIVHMLHARDEWERLINQVGSARVGIGSVSGHWSVKDIIAHVMAHEQHLADRISEIVRGESVRVCMTRPGLDAFQEEFGYPDFDSPLISAEAASEWIIQKYRNVPMEEAVADELHAFECLLSGVSALSEEQLNELGLVRRVRHVTAEHYRQHASDIRKRFKQPLRQF